MKKSSKYFIMISVTVLFGLTFLGKYTDPYFDLKCPDNFDNRETQMADYNKFLDRFLQKNPNATGQKIINERLTFFEKHNCIEAIERYKISQTGQESSTPEVKKVIQKSFEERGFRVAD